jgi:23S rRNA (cytosine1962-C5)-methyltransferase
VSDLIIPAGSPIRLTLARDLVRAIRSGHPWVYRDALRSPPKLKQCIPAELCGPDGGRVIATGFYDPGSPIGFRACHADGAIPLNNDWAAARLDAAIRHREQVIPANTTGYRLANGEGDGLPGLVIDRYAETAVIKLDGAGPSAFWNADGIAEWLQSRLGLDGVVERTRDRESPFRILAGEPQQEPEFLEHSLRFTANVEQGQKTGFFLDQRENRRIIRDLSRGRNVLNLFSYTGGFSVAAGIGGAARAVSVDSAGPALEVAALHWTLNGLDSNLHETVAADAFEYLETAAKGRREWDVVIVDPPSFAPSAKSVERAKAAYTRLFAAAAKVTSAGGLLAACSCSSHIDSEMFLDLCLASLSQARRRGTVVQITGQPADHPWPLACPELRYLKFVLLQL